MKNIISVLLTLTIVFGLLAFAVVPASAEHAHIAGDWWQNDDTGHWNQCIGDGNCQEKVNYQKHDTSQYAKYCTICQNRIDHVCYNSEATCQNGGRCLYCPYGAPENPDNHITYGTMIDDKNHKVVCDCGYIEVASAPHVLNSWDDIDGQPGMEESWCEVCFHAVARKKQSGVESSNGGSGSSGNSGNSGSSGNLSSSGVGSISGESGNGNGQSSATDAPLNSTVTSDPSFNDTDTSEPTSDTGASSESLNDNNTIPNSEDNDKDSLLWLWILLIVVAVGGTVTAVILMKKKKLFSKNEVASE